MSTSPDRTPPHTASMSVDLPLTAIEELRLSEARHRALLRLSSAMIWTQSPNGQVLEPTPDWEKVTGQTFAEIRDFGWLNALHPDDVDRIRGQWNACLHDETPADFSYRLRRHDGVYRLIHIRALPLYNDDGMVREWAGISEDITDSARVESLLREGYARLQEFADSLPQMAWIVGADGKAEWFNQRFYDYTGMNRESPLGWGWTAAFHPDDLALTTERWTRLIAEHGEFIGESRLLRHDGAVRWFLIRTRPLFDSNGTLLRWYGTAIDIDERKRAEDARAESEVRFRTLADHMSQLAWIAEADGAIHWYNQRWLDYTGTTLESLQGWGWRAVHDPGQVARVEEKFRRSIAAGEIWEDTFRLRGADGRFRWFLSRATPLRDAHGKTLRWFGTNTDITEERALRTALAESEERFRGIADNIVQLAWIADAQGEIVWVNQRCLDYFGRPAEEILGTGWRAVHHPDHLERAENNFRRAIAAGKAWDDLFPMRGKDGSYRWFLSRGVPSLDAQSGTLRWFGTNTDITQEREISLALQTSEARLKATLAQAQMGTYEFDLQTMQGRWDARTGALWGLNKPRELALAEVVETVVHPDDRPMVRAALAAALDPAGDGSFDTEARMIGADDGVLRRVHSHALVEFVDGAPRRMFGGNLDVTNRWQAEVAQAAQLERERRESARLRALNEASLKINAAVRSGSVVATVTEEARRLVPAHMAVGGSLIDEDFASAIIHVSVSDKHAAWRDWKPAPDGSGIERLVREYKRPWRLTQAELEAHPSWRGHDAGTAAHPPLRGWLAVPLIGGDGANLGLLQLSDRVEGEFSEDDEAVLVQLATVAAAAIENSRLLQALHQADRRKDEFLATLAHELRNPLAPIGNALELMRRRKDAATQERGREVIERQTVQMKRLVDDLLEVSRISRGTIELQREILDLARVLEAAVETARPRLESAGHRFVIDLAPARLPVSADAMRLAQVFTNLLNNAAKFTPDGGEVGLEARQVGAEAVVTVRDSGIGIPAEMLPQVFEMFAQVNRNLRGAQDGLGIGLAIVRQLVAMHGGSVSAHSAGLGAGSEFVVRLPLAMETAAELSPVAQPKGAKLGALLAPILVVDDNRDAADSLAELLSLIGVEARAVYAADAALVLFDELRPAAALLDLGMPDMDGFCLARRLRSQARDATLRLIALSGWDQEEDRRRSREAGFDAHLVKPVDVEALLGLLAANRG